LDQERKQREMAIGSVMEKGSQIIAYDEHNRQLFAKFKGQKPGDGLKGYTGSTVSIQNGSQLLTYDEKGHQISARFV
jgi:hypothetical protein